MIVLLPDNTWDVYVPFSEGFEVDDRQYASPTYYGKYVDSKRCCLGLWTTFAKCVSILTAVHRALDARLPYDVINSLCISCRGYRRIFSRGSCNRANMATRMVISLIDPETHRIAKLPFQRRMLVKTGDKYFFSETGRTRVTLISESCVKSATASSAATFN